MNILSYFYNQEYTKQYHDLKVKGWFYLRFTAYPIFEESNDQVSCQKYLSNLEIHK